jgi:hypothetical protein
MCPSGFGVYDLICQVTGRALNLDHNLEEASSKELQGALLAFDLGISKP